MALATAKSHFDEDIGRARALLDHAAAQPAGLLRDDISRSAWMLAVGACDAFFSDAYADLIARTLRAKDLQPGVALPDRLNNLKVPVIAIVRRADGWRWRMAARELIESENVLSLDKIKKLFNHFFRQTHKLLNESSIEAWILSPNSRQRLFGITSGAYNGLTNDGKSKARKRAIEKIEERMTMIFQRRHDCIHNCDRPRTALTGINVTTVEKVIEDIQFLVTQSCDAIRAEFPEYLRTCGFDGVARNQVSV